MNPVHNSTSSSSSPKKPLSSSSLLSSALPPSSSPSSLSTAIMVKGPECEGEESEEGVVSVRDARCVDELPDGEYSSPPSSQQRRQQQQQEKSFSSVHQQVPVLLQSMFRGTTDSSLFNNNSSDDDNEEEFKHEEHELVEHPFSSSQNDEQTTGKLEESVNKNQHDRSLLTGYKYEFCNNADNQDDEEVIDGNCCQIPRHQENSNKDDDDDDDDDDDEHSGNEEILKQATFDPLTPLDNILSNISFTSTNTANRYNNNNNQIVYLLGKSYNIVSQYDEKRDDELSLFWFTYRCDFPEIAPYRITTDAGWGCMLRSAQMMLAQTLRLHYKGRIWKSHRLSLTQQRRETFIRSLLTWMADYPSSNDNIYSLHNMVAAGMSKYEILPGEWYGPGTSCYVVRDLVHAHEARQIAMWKKKQHQQQNKDEQVTPGSHSKSLRVFRVYVAPQGTVYKDSIRELMTKESRAQYEHTKKMKAAADSKQQQEQKIPDHPLATAEEDMKQEILEQEATQNLEWDTGLLLLIPLRLGLNGINEEYTKSIANLFSIPQSVGILGGRPRGARWFYGALADGSKILGLDPHTVQISPRRRSARLNGKAASVVDISEEYLRSVYTTNQEAVPLLRMDPSIALGFYCRTRQDLEQVERCMSQWRAAYPKLPEIFTFAETSPDYATNGGMSSSVMNDLMEGDMAGSALLDMEDHDSCDVSDEDEYVML